MGSISFIYTGMNNTKAMKICNSQQKKVKESSGQDLVSPEVWETLVE